jgi:hypothetical protein
MSVHQTLTTNYLGRSDAERLLLAGYNASGNLSINVALGGGSAAAGVRGANRGIVSVVRLGGSRLASQNSRNEELKKTIVSTIQQVNAFKSFSARSSLIGEKHSTWG